MNRLRAGVMAAEARSALTMQMHVVAWSRVVAIGANPLDFFLAASPSSLVFGECAVLTTHTVLPGPVNLWVLFPRTYFFLPDTFSRKTFSDRLRTPPLTLYKGPQGRLCSQARGHWQQKVMTK